MDTSTLVGFIAGLFTTLAFVPQVLKIWHTKSAKDVSLLAFAAFTLGVALWLLYGILQEEPPMILWNSVTLALAVAIIGMKLKYG
jgi:MtN3 and saliva related transmembrane protein